MFLLDPAADSVLAVEPNVVAVFRAVTTLRLTLEGWPQQPCEAFLCVVREEGGEQVYPAIHLANSRKTLVYRAAARLPGPELLKQGTAFLGELGFRMEAVNLGGNAALRQVVLSGIKILNLSGVAPARPPRAATPQAVAATASPSPGSRPIPQAEVRPAPTAQTDTQARLSGELQGLREEHAALKESAARRVAELEGELAQLRAELAHQRSTRGEDHAAPALENAAHELALLREEYEALRAEYVLINEELTERQNQVQQLEGELVSTRQAATAEIAKLKASLLRQEPAPPPARQAAAPVPPGAAAASAPVAGFPEVATAAVEEPVAFRLVPDLAAIPCVSTDDVVDLRVSFNAIRMTCAGAKAQNCNAYICGVQRLGRREVYLAFYLTEDRRALIYAPERQPVDDAGYARTVEGAIAFADVSGFIVNMEPLGGGAAARAKVFEKVPVLGSH